MDRGLVLATLVILHIACAASAPESGDARTFFKGKTMTYVIAAEPGGGYDTYGRLVSQHLGKYLGLNRVVVKNVSGGGSVAGTNEIYSARPDGLTLGIFNTGIIYAQLLKRAGLRADLQRMSWVGKAGGEPRVLVVSAKARFRSLDEMRAARRPVLLGVNGVGNEAYYDSMLLAHAVGLQVKPVIGMSSVDAHLSMMRGEIEGRFSSASTARPFVANGYGFMIIRVGSSADVDEGIPDASRFATSPSSVALVELVRSLAMLARWTAGPPGIPADRLAVLREAYMAALQDPGLLDAARRLDIPIVPMDGATLASAIEQSMAVSPDTVAVITSIAGAERTD
jgi:tripartite-type tricarboxylate transporter receptor subunit TctC